MSIRPDELFAPRRLNLNGDAPKRHPETYRVDLEPDRPDALRLRELYRALRRAWTAHDDALLEEEAIDYGDPTREAARDARYDLRQARNLALGAITDAVLEVTGCPKPGRERWERFGHPLAIVSVGRRLFIVSATEQAEYIPYPDDMGCLDTIIVDL